MMGKCTIGMSPIKNGRYVLNDEINGGLIIENWFPISIGYVFNPNHREIESSLVSRCLDIKGVVSSGGDGWSSDVYNTEGKHDVWADEKFDELNKWIMLQVNSYKDSSITSPETNFELSKIEGWMNIYQNGDYQEYHNHIGSFISCIYFLKADENASYVRFKAPYYDTHNVSDNISFYKPDPGKLLIFRSYIPHSVCKHTDDNLRISVAYNFS